ncbi:GspE/PulE family protein [Dethiosulfovibrio salsuginis]|uniref:Type IV pilus assembly protein PilB n=1 Tax=Dethiosulfovibrio salsuginis TaxID=561720 RepID=A0A1X7I1S8_9BACT|nr:GspE/PulE family protein [Dethiosulfovibrio salsuginis]SMG07949.1 type IV pilus assembly protein PilB [Dethiosulfovibrio salsuginis]
MDSLKNVKLGDILVDSNALTPSQLESALQEQRQSGMRLGEILIKNGWLSENQLIEALSTQLHIPQVSISRYRPEPEALRLIPQGIAERLKVIPMRITDEDHLMVATSDPLNIVAADELRMMSGREIDFGLCPASHILRDLSRIYTMQETLNSAEDLEIVSSGSEGIELDLGQAISTAAADDAPVINLVNTILEQAVKDRSSDIHIEPFEKDTQVRYRVDGQLFNATNFSRGLHPAVTSRIKIMANIDISEKRKPQDGRILIKVMDRRVDLRVSTLPTVYGEKTVIRVLDQSNAMVGLEKLGFDQKDRDKIDRLLKVPYGIILVTGPTGSGKSTTLYSFLERINTPDVNIVTVEDPVEYSIAGINQVQVSEKAGRTFSSVLRAILRQDPDKIMIGEMRDTETANLAIRAALTGHLVLSTLHTNDAPSAAIRLGDMGVPPFLVASSVVAVIAQRLVRRLCPDCKVEYTVEDPICRSLALPEGSKAYRSRGCDTCRGTGHVGRTSVFEIMEMNEEIRNRIIDQETAVSIKKAAIAMGMRTLREAALSKVLDGTTTVEEMLNVTTL